MNFRKFHDCKFGRLVSTNHQPLIIHYLVDEWLLSFYEFIHYCLKASLVQLGDFSNYSVKYLRCPQSVLLMGSRTRKSQDSARLANIIPDSAKLVFHEGGGDKKGC